MITLRVLGSIDLRNKDGQSVHTLLAQPKRVALLALLCTRASEGFTRRDLVASLFWPEHDHEHARAGLRTALHALRRGLGDVIATRGNDEVGLAADAIECDAIAFEKACREQRWQEAIDLYRGDFLAGMHVFDASAELDRWIEEQRGRYRKMATNAAWQLVTVEERRGNLPAALELARRAIDSNGTDEVGIRRLLLLHEQLGDRAGAVAAFDAFSRKLRAELDVDPSVETRELIEAIRSGSKPARASDSPVQRDARSPVSPSAGNHLRRWAVAVAGLAVVLVMLGSAWSLSHRANATALPAPATGSVSELALGVRGFLRVASMPMPLAQMIALYDGLRDKVYVFGGNIGGRHTNELWELDQPGMVGSMTWTRLEPRGRAPTPRSSHAAAYDSTSDRIIVVGGAMGYTSPCANDVWVAKNPSRRGGPTEWQELRPSGEPPSPRADHSATWLPRARRLIVFGGHDCIARRNNDLWVLDFSRGERPTWRRLPTLGTVPAPRGGHAMFYDEPRDRVVMYGGGTDVQIYADVWELTPASSDSARWRELRVRGATRAPIHHHRVAWDPVGRHMIVFGGRLSTGPTEGVWMSTEERDGSLRWRQIDGLPTTPPTRITHGLAYNSKLDQLIVMGGQNDGAMLFDTWVLMNATQRRLGKQTR